MNKLHGFDREWENWSDINRQAKEEYFGKDAPIDSLGTYFSKEEYLAWKENWRTYYKKLSKEITAWKRARKTLSPYFHEDAAWVCARLKFYANKYMEQRSELKDQSIVLKNKNVRTGTIG